MSATSDTVAAHRSGGCHKDCGRIRFEAKGGPDYPHTCSCRDCKKRGGAPMMSWVAFPLDGFEWTGEGGEPTWYDTYPGKTKRGFCANCGTHIAAYDYGDTWMGVNIPALDEPDGEGLTPVNQSCRGEAVPWLGQVADTQHNTTG
ncbi:GFA family protein [Streptomyces sp. NPDC001502]|uniref:GFA family protein n=1 Tax=Streptomyces sp. NPDC001502 TaxID=3364578 RepID=UPI0036A726BC